jgi:hypothetical protein
MFLDTINKHEIGKVAFDRGQQVLAQIPTQVVLQYVGVTFDHIEGVSPSSCGEFAIIDGKVVTPLVKVDHGDAKRGGHKGIQRVGSDDQLCGTGTVKCLLESGVGTRFKSLSLFSFYCIILLQKSVQLLKKNKSK